MASRLLDSLLDLSVAPGYTKVGYRLRGLSWSSATAGHLTEGAALVTGASSGLGEAACEGLARAGARVHMLVRDLERGGAARERIRSRLESDSHLELRSCDLADLAAVRHFARRFAADERRLDVLVQQRGAVAGRATADRGRVRAGVRHQRARARSCSPSLLVEPLRLGHHPRVINVSSGGMYTARLDVDDLQLDEREFDGPSFYAHTKRAEVALTEVWANGSRTSGSVAIHASRLGRHAGPCSVTPRFHRLMRPLLRDSHEGADTIVWLATDARGRGLPGGRSGTTGDPARRTASRAPASRAAERRAPLGQCARLGRLETGPTRELGRAGAAGSLVRVAIVGGGVPGSCAARRLHDAGHEATLFEGADYPGGHTNTIRVDTERGAWNVDTGFIVFNDRNYPNFERLLDQLGVASQTTDMSFSVADEAGRFEWASRPAGLFANPAHLVDRRFHRMLLDLLRFNREARALVGANGSGPSLRRFLADGGYSDYFIERLIVPQVSAVWSADPDQLWSFPASFLAEFFENHGILALTGRPRWRTVVGGSRTYVEALIAPLRDRIRLRTPVRRIDRYPDRVEIACDGGSQSFDEVVIATHSDQALAMLADPSPAEREILGAFPLPAQRDGPAHRRAHASAPPAGLGELELPPGGRPVGLTTVTYDMNRLQSLSADRQFCVTLNRTEAIDPARIIGRIEYDHPVFTRAGMAAQQRHGEISGRDRTHYCGAYWRWGFHEDGVWSALRACEC